MRKKSWVTLLFFTLLFIQLSVSQAQKIEKKIILSWNENLISSQSNDEIQEFLHFKDAIYALQHPSLPCYFEKISIPAFYTDYTTTILDVQYENLDPHDQSLIPNDYHQKLPAVEVSSAYEKGDAYMLLSFIPIVENENGQYQKINSLTLSIQWNVPTKKSARKDYVAQSVLATGNWYNLYVSKSGIYKVTYEDLISMGISSPISSASLSLFGNGGGMLPEANAAYRQDDLQEIAIWIEDGGDGTIGAGDYFLFYGESPHTWIYDTSTTHFSHKTNIYTDSTCYFITNTPNIGLKKRVSITNNTNLTHNKVINDYIHYDYHEEDILNFGETGKEWFGEVFDAATQRTFGFTLPNFQSKPARLVVAGASSASTPSHFSISINGNPIGSIGFLSNNSNSIVTLSSDALSFTPSSSSVSVLLDYNKPTTTAAAYLDWVELEATCALHMHSAQVSFRSPSSIGEGNISRFNIGNAPATTRVWDVTDPTQVTQHTLSLQDGKYGFTANTEKLLQFVAFDGTSFLSVTPGKSVANQNLHATNNVDMVIVTHPKFLSEAIRLANFRQQNNGVSVKVVTTQQVYNEFSSGSQDPIAIRDFMKMIYDKTNKQFPKHLLLVGRPCYDFRGRIQGTEIFVPNYQYASNGRTISEYAFYSNDDTFGLLDDNEGGNTSGLYDIAVGRIPCSTLMQAKTAVDKSIIYTEKKDLVGENSTKISNFGDWRNIVAFCADDEEFNDFVHNADAFSDTIKNNNPNINFDKIYLDAYQQVSNAGGQRYPEVTRAINNRMNRGSLFFTYIGHSGKDGWSAERVLEFSDINQWTNQYNLPIMLTLSCTFGYYDRPAISPAEQILFHKQGGASALITSTRESWSTPNNYFGKHIFHNLFKKRENTYYTVGELMAKAKNDQGGSISSLAMYALMGDPSMPFAIPTYHVVTDSINHHAIGTQPDTIKALSKMVVSGRIVDNQGQTLTSMNGSLYPSVFDKTIKSTTLANDPNSSPFEFETQKSILFKGNCTIKNGHFTFSFYVPRDIDYTYGNGKISYYGASASQDASGHFTEFIIGGTDTNNTQDDEGPVIELYLNDENFVDGSIVNPSPTLIAKIKDNYGINTTGNGIGHDLTAIIDNATESQIVLNDYYQTEKDSFNTGTIRYPLNELPIGKHTLMLRAWDINNNHSDREITFEVVSDEKLTLRHVLNYPNPFTTHTEFFFEQNQNGGIFDIQIQIYTISGKLVKTINTNQYIEGNRSAGIPWDGLDDYGDKIGKGVYLYKLSVRNQNLETAEVIEKLVIL